MGVDLDPLDDVFSDEVVTAVKRPSKFQPKSKLRPPPKTPPAAPEINKSRAQETSDAAPSGYSEAESANPADKNCDPLPENDGVLRSSIETLQGETAGILSGLENVDDFFSGAYTPNMGVHPPSESELVAANDSNPGDSRSDFDPLAAIESAVSTSEMEAVGSSDAANLTSESGLEGVDFRPDSCLDNPFFDMNDAEKYPSSSTFQQDDVLDLASLGFPDPSPNEADPNIPSNLESISLTELDSGPPPEAPSKLETRRAETRSGNAEENETATGRSLRPRKKKQNESSRVNDKGAAAARKRNVPEETPEPSPKKPKRFSHSTRRRRRVNRDLLETPEDEIDYQKLSLRDLILLGEHKEKQMKKEEATTSQERPRENEVGEGDAAAVEDATLYFNYQTYMDKPRPIRWSKQDTETFYEAIRQFGTDLSLIQQLFPGLTRQQIKLKYKKEERQHPFRLHEAVTNRPKDHSHFKMVIERLQQIAAEQNKKEDEEEEEGREDLAAGGGETSEGGSHFRDGESKDEQKEHDEDVSNECVFSRHEEGQVEDEEDDDDAIDWSQYKTL